MSFNDVLIKLREIASLLPEDDPDKLEMLNVEGDFSQLMEWALRKRNDLLAYVDQCDALAQIYLGRKESFYNRSEHIKQTIECIMNAAGERKYTGPSGTVSFRSNPPKLIVVDEDQVPDEYFISQPKLDKSLLKIDLEDGKQINGAYLSNGSESLTVRVK